MKTYIEKESTKRSEKLIAWAKKNSKTFVTGAPLSVYKYGVDENNKLTFATFITERGSEDIYTGGDCLASSIEDSVKIVRITGK